MVALVVIYRDSANIGLYIIDKGKHGTQAFQGIAHSESLCTVFSQFTVKLVVTNEPLELPTSCCCCLVPLLMTEDTHITVKAKNFASYILYKSLDRPCRLPYTSAELSWEHEEWEDWQDMSSLYSYSSSHSARLT